MRPVLFTLAFIGASSTGLAWARARALVQQEQEEVEEVLLDGVWRRIRRHGNALWHGRDPSDSSPSIGDNLRAIWTDWQANTPDTQKLMGLIIGVNAGIFVLWQLPALQPFMARHFLHFPTSRRPYTLLTSTFSHKDFMHLGFNMVGGKGWGHPLLRVESSSQLRVRLIPHPAHPTHPPYHTTTPQYALYGFLPLVAYAGSFSSEQTLSFYLGCGVLSALGSHLMSAMITRNVIPSLGASGALWGVLACTAFLMPDARVGIIFLPGVESTISQLLPWMVLLDVVGVVRGWRFFDHTAHLTGALGGYLYYEYGRDAWKRMVAYFYRREKAARAARTAPPAARAGWGA